nr:PREDICTED: DNA damage-regulated autophagy modulator protein 1 [Opisthocomus hoazin]
MGCNNAQLGPLENLMPLSATAVQQCGKAGTDKTQSVRKSKSPRSCASQGYTACWKRTSQADESRTGQASTFSDTGTKPPESGIFGFMINISALLGVITMYIRYLLIEKQNESSHFVRSSCNMFSLCIGLMGCIGMGIVATFQELSVPSVHDIGALVAFGSGVVYITLQSIISYKSCPQWNTYFVCHIRMAISVISCIAFIPMIVFASRISITKIDWTPGEKDYTYHFVSAICEWTVAFGFIFFFLTFIRDFQRLSLRISTEILNDS